jgi:alpha-ribazole phosphatase
MTFKTLTFIRHAESVSNAGGITLPHHQVPLSELGQRQAQALPSLLDLRPTSVLVSAMIRTHQTARPFCTRTGVKASEHQGLDEFSVIDPELIKGLTGDQRKPFVKEYWDAPDPHRRLGKNADTFAEFEQRVIAFLATMETLPDHSVIFGHGIWFGLLLWRMLGYDASTAETMRSFRRFQQSLPMPNCAGFTLVQSADGHWSVKARPEISRALRLIAGDQ